MKTYYFTAKVERVIEDEITVAVSCNGPLANAIKIAENVAKVYPQPVEGVSEDVKYCFTENREYKHSDVISIERVRPSNDRVA